MIEDRWVAVVVPAYNEEKLIGRVLETMPALVDRIVVVDDASTDRTWDVLVAAQARYGCRLKAIRHDRNAGVGGAIVTGYKAVMDGEPPAEGLVVVMAGDGPMDPQGPPEILPPLPQDGARYTNSNR